MTMPTYKLLIQEAIHHQDQVLLSRHIGHSVKFIAGQFGVTPSRIYQILAQGKKRYLKYGAESGLTEYMRVIAKRPGTEL